MRNGSFMVFILSKSSGCFSNRLRSGVEQWSARQPHELEVVGSNPTSAPKQFLVCSAKTTTKISMWRSDKMNIYTCTFEIEIGGRWLRQTIQAPQIMIQHRFVEFVQQFHGSTEPARIKLSRIVPIYSQFDKRWINRENSIEYCNAAYDGLRK